MIWLQRSVLHSLSSEQRGKMQRGFGEAGRRQPKANRSGEGKQNKHSGLNFRCLVTFPVQLLNTGSPLAETLRFLCSLSSVRPCLVTCLKHCEFQSYFGITPAGTRKIINSNPCSLLSWRKGIKVSFQSIVPPGEAWWGLSISTGRE